MTDPGAGLPPEGITVVALEQAVAAPLATRHLADLGARVIKIERLGEGDFARGYDAAVRGIASHFVWLSRGKESLCVDVKSDAGLAAVQRMGLSHASIAPYDAYPTADGQILIGVQNDRGWRALVADVFGLPELADDPRFATNIARVRHRAETDAFAA